MTRWKVLIFDMDGTLTASSEKIDEDFGKYLLRVFKSNSCAIVSGADYESIKNQLGFDLCYHAEWIFACNGAHVIKNGVTQHKSNWELKRSVRNYLQNFLRDSDFPHRTGKHFDDRIGMCNFSVLGRGATKEQRRHYIAWDIATNERQHIAKKINTKFNGVVARVAGETGIDLMHNNMSKAKTLDYLEKDSVKFFGDKMKKGGNDFPLANKLDPEQCFPVNGWQDTYQRLVELGF